jgi:hypothetical protein
MTPKAWPIAILLALAGCAVENPLTPAERVPVRWQLVERPYGTLTDRGAAGDGHVDPESTVLTFAPVYTDDLESAHHFGAGRLSVEIVALYPDRDAGPGEPVSAIVRVANASPRARYRLRVEPLDPRVRVLGERDKSVKGSETATFRFTAGAAGKQGITVDVEVAD